MLRLQVLEGRYGQVRAEGDPKLAAAAQDYLRPLRGGEVIESAPLERAALLLSDLPGVTATPSIRPGPDLGAGDLPVQVQRGDRVNGSVGLDNQDNRYTGQYRANASLAVNSPFLAGDQITVRAQGTSEDLYFGDVGYSLSLGSRARTSAASPAPAWARAWPWGAGAPRPPRPGAPTAASRSPTAATASRLSG